MNTKARLVLERTYKASIEDVWALWTTKDGIESWWGPEGFSVSVSSMDLRVGGTLRYVMTATDPGTLAFMKKAGMPIATEASIVYSAIEPLKRLEYATHADFVPGVDAYDVGTQVTLFPSAGGVRMVLEFDPMHNEEWTGRAVQGWESQLRKLDGVIAK